MAKIENRVSAAARDIIIVLKTVAGSIGVRLDCIVNGVRPSIGNQHDQPLRIMLLKFG